MVYYLISGKELIMKYIKQLEPTLIRHLQVKEQYLKTRANLINERKTAHSLLLTKFKKHDIFVAKSAKLYANIT